MSPPKTFLLLFKMVADRLLGTRAAEWYWRFRHRLDRQWPRSYISQESLSHPHRKILADTVAAYAPFRRVLEIGCASGPNLLLLAKRFPDATFHGLDISANAVRAGNAWLAAQGVTNVSLAVGRADDLGRFKDKSIDIVFTDAVLVYVGPDKIHRVAAEMLRVARRAIVLLERTSKEPHAYVAHHWAHNWRTLFSKFGEYEVEVTPLPPASWSGTWAKSGAVVEVRLRQQRDLPRPAIR